MAASPQSSGPPAGEGAGATAGEVDRLRWRLDALERRLDRLEEALGPTAAPHGASPLPANAAFSRPHVTDAAALTRPLSPAPLPPTGRAEARPARAVSGPPSLAAPDLPPVAAPKPPPIPAHLIAESASRPGAPAKSSRSLETLIGQNWASWVGAMVLFLGIIFFLKYAWDQGWIRPSPAARVAAAVSCGALLAAVGEWLHWRRMRALAGTLYGAGVAVIIASFFGAYAYFDPPVMRGGSAFVAVALTAAASVGIALRINVSLVAMIGLIGAYLAPNFLAGPLDRSGFFVLYLAALASVALGLTQLRCAWVLVRWLALFATYLWLSLWWESTGRVSGHAGLAMLAAVGFAGAFVAEAALTLWRYPPRRVTPAGASFDARADDESPGQLPRLRLETGPLSAHAVPAALVAIFGSMIQLLRISSHTDPARLTIAALILAGMLLLPGLALNHLRPAWIAARWVVLVGSYAWLALWYNRIGRLAGDELLAVLWALGLYVAFQFESVLTLRRGAEHGTKQRIGASLAAMSLAATAGSVGVLLWIWAQTDPIAVGLIAIVLAFVQAGAAIQARSREFFISSMLQSAALVTLAAPLLLDEFAVTLAWIILAAALALAAWQLNLPQARGWAAALLLLALARLVIFDLRNPSLTTVQFELFGQVATRWLLTGWTIALLYHLLAWLRPGGGRWPMFDEWIARHVPAARIAPGPAPARVPHPAKTASILAYGSHIRDAVEARTLHTPWRATSSYDAAGALFAAFGTILFLAFTLLRWSGPVATLALIGWLGGLLLLAPLGRRMGYGTQVWILGILITARWLVLDNLVPLANAWNGGGGAPAILNLPAMCGVLLAAAVIAGLRLAPRLSEPLRELEKPPAGDDSSTQTVLIVWAAAVIFALLNFETLRYIDSIGGLEDRAIVKQVAMSVLWAMVGFGGIVFGFRRRLAAVRWAALSLLAVTLAKILIIDMAGVQAIWRILSFLAVGALLLAVSYVYHRQSQPEAT